MRRIAKCLDEIGAIYSNNEVQGIIIIHETLKNGVSYDVVVKKVYSDAYTMIVAYMPGVMVSKNKLKIYESLLNQQSGIRDVKYELSKKDGSVRVRLDMDEQSGVDCAALVRRLRDIRTLVSYADDNALLAGDGE